MTILETFIGTPSAGAVGWTVLHSLWQGAIVSAALAAALFAVRSPRIRYAAACAAMLLMLGGFTATLVKLMPQGLHGSRTAGLSASTSWNIGAIAISRPDTWDPSLEAIAPWLAPFWIAGVFVFSLRHLAGFLSVQRLRRRGVCYAAARWQKELARLSAQLRVSKPVLLLESCVADAPIVLGHFRPFILMPVGLLAGLPAGQIEAILLHELAHIRRHDYLVNVLQHLVEGLLFYHPAAWWIARVIRAERENCCDDAVVSIVGDAREYAAALTALEQNRWSGREPAVAATGGSIVTRIRRLLYPKGSNGAWPPFIAALTLIATAAVTLAAWQAGPQPQQTLASPQTDRPATSPYIKWMEEDVAYLISDDERAAFQKLATDEEREKFIEQFWLRRDPTPGTIENELKEEHYRRIGYTNARFGARSKAGWKTDRGRIYIQFGPPDEIESHPAGSASAAPYEIWNYQYIQGIGNNVFITFRDLARNGEYQLAPGNNR